ncbi:MAG TPA: hypothetical protein VEA38_03095 [Terriglobales bacterium]|nr:hypothetical protein [Terriglobales bacterium]
MVVAGRVIAVFAAFAGQRVVMRAPMQAVRVRRPGEEQDEHAEQRAGAEPWAPPDGDRSA